MLARLLSLAAALLLAIASPQAHANARKLPSETARPARVSIEHYASAKIIDATPSRIREICLVPLKCASTFGVTGYQKDAATGLYYAGARFYDPLIGGFNGMDPWSGDNSRPITLNKYLYANGNPTVYVDPTGKYGEAGHYYTIYYAALRVGFDDKQAQSIAFLGQVPDEVDRWDAIATQVDHLFTLTTVPGILVSAMGIAPTTERRNSVHQDTHVLRGDMEGEAVTQQVLEAIQLAGKDIDAASVLTHPLGDSFSHRETTSPNSKMFAQGFGHLMPSLQGDHPDLIQNRPDDYLKYVDTLTRTLGAMKGLTEEEAAQKSLELQEELGGMSRQKPGTGISFGASVGFPGGPASRVSVTVIPAQFYTDEELENLSIEWLRALIVSEGGSTEYAPESLPEKLMPTPILQAKSTEQAARDARDGGVEASAPRTESAYRRAVKLMELVRQKAESKAVTVKESSDGNGLTVEGGR